MSANINMVVMTGAVEGVVDLRTSAAGKPYARFTFASKRDGAKPEDATLSCVCFGALAERVARNAASPLYVAGRLKTERWEWEGKPCSKLMLNVEELRVLADDGGAKESPQTPAGATNDGPPF